MSAEKKPPARLPDPDATVFDESLAGPEGGSPPPAPLNTSLQSTIGETGEFVLNDPSRSGLAGSSSAAVPMGHTRAELASPAGAPDGRTHTDPPGTQVSDDGGGGTAAMTMADPASRPDATFAATGVFVPPPPDPNATGAFYAAQTEADANFADSGRGGQKTMAGNATGEYDPTLTAGAAAAAAARRTPQKPTDPSRCGRYILKRYHARGGMGEIWMAEDPDIGRSVALKRMLSQRPDQVHRFFVEAQVTGQLEHPGIVPVHELGMNEDGSPYYVMKFVRGRTLQKVIEEFHEKAAKGEATDAEKLALLQIFHSLCQTVAYAHSRGVLHRDLKPENVMLGPYGETILLDWGIAKVMGQPDIPGSDDEGAYVTLTGADPETATRAGSVIGTPMYMAPEVALGLTEQVDQRSDIYLLGATLYEILTGRQPRRGKTAIEMLKQAQKVPPTPAIKINPRIPKQLDAICRKAMAHAQDERYPTAMELANDVQRYVAGETISAYQENRWEQAVRWAKRHKTAIARTAAAIVLVSAATAGFITLRNAQLETAAAMRRTRELATREKARADVREFRKLADAASFYAVTTEPVSERAPYFDPAKAEETANQALAITDPWGPSFEGLVLEEERDSIRQRMSELLLLTAHLKSRGSSKPEVARAVLNDVDRAASLAKPTRSSELLRAWAFEQLGEKDNAKAARDKANDPKLAESALDHFFRGEELRRSSLHADRGRPSIPGWMPDDEVMNKAIAEYREALRLNPNHFWSHLQIGRCLLNLRKINEAIDSLGGCIALRPDSPWGYNVRAFAFTLLKRYHEAEVDLDKAIELSPDLQAARLTRGLAYWHQGKNDEAIAEFGRVLSAPKGSRLLEAAYYRGQLYAQLNEKQKALDDFNLALAEDPNFLAVYPLRAYIYLLDNKKAEALSDIDHYVADGTPLNPNGWEIHARRGRELRRQFMELPKAKQSTQAAARIADLGQEELFKAVARQGQIPAIYDDLGAVLEQRGNIKVAVESYNRGLNLNPNDLKLRIKRGWALELLGRRGEALADFIAAARIDPTNAEAHTGIGYLQALANKPAEAQREADLALIYGSDHYLILHNVAGIYASLGDLAGRDTKEDQDVAIALLKRAIFSWKQHGGKSEIDYIKADPAFKSMRGRKEFRELLDDNQPPPGRLGMNP
jgi:serine/threonine protein kinase/lipoprotein NlpI